MEEEHNITAWLVHEPIQAEVDDSRQEASKVIVIRHLRMVFFSLRVANANDIFLPLLLPSITPTRLSCAKLFELLSLATEK